jgi:uncharacterized SAM-binding protein YcdF (DUF218 family)
MVPPILKEFFVPGGYLFFLLVAAVGTLLLYTKKNGRAGRRLLTALVLFYWLLSTPAIALPLIHGLSAHYPPIQTVADARGATALVVLGGGVEIYRSRGASVRVGSRQHSLRALEAARLYHLLGEPWVIVTGGLPSGPLSEAKQMATMLTLLGVPATRIIEEDQSRNTHDHALNVPPILRERGVSRFVLVTSRQHMARALRAFHAAGLDPVPSSPDVYVREDRPFSTFLPSATMLESSASMMYDLSAMLYYRARGWV